MDASVDLDLLRVVRRLRAEHGACVVRDVAQQLGMSVPGTQHRIQRAVDVGHLERSDTAGSLRVGVAAGNLVAAGGGVDLIVIDDEVFDARLA